MRNRTKLFLTSLLILISFLAYFLITNNSVDSKTNENKMLQKSIDRLEKKESNTYHEKINTNSNKILYLILKDLQLWQRPDENSKVITEIKTNDTIEVVDYKGIIHLSEFIKKDLPYEWWRIQYKNQSGWIKAKHYSMGLLDNGKQKWKQNVQIIE